MANNPFGKAPGGMGNMGPGDLMKLAKQAERMMADSRKIEEELGGITVEGSAGGGMVKVRANGKPELLEVKISKEAVDPNDIEMLEALVVTAVREAMEKATALRTERLQGLMPPGMNIPGLF